MSVDQILKSQIFKIGSHKEFNFLALEIFKFQAEKNPVYKEYIGYLGIDPSGVDDICKIPFLPIRFFKTLKVFIGNGDPAIIFTSSGTTGALTSSHMLTDTLLYEKSFLSGFRYFYGNPKDYYILALLPSYLEREGSSLVYMVSRLIKETQSSESGFFLNNLEEFTSKFFFLKKRNDRKIMIWGVSYALLDLAEKYAPDLSGAILIETGGMKGKRKEIIREELHQILCKNFNLSNVHSEYGMTELLSQAYSKEQGVFYTPPWMKILIRDIYDPFRYMQDDRTGGINIIDLANLYSCSFIETEDLGSKLDDGFKVLGRFDTSDIRGCNLMVD
ncbi:MAG: acyl transferase [Bacteroidota bacterium]|nr:acyl transferase [Bacteroidota bacterium]